MAVAVTNDLDFLAARLHGRRSQLAEGRRLDELCRIRTVAELARQLWPDRPVREAADLQRRLIRDLIDEMALLAAGLTDANQALILWMRVRFQVENLKVLARGAVNGLPLETLAPHLVQMPDDLALDVTPLAGPASDPFERFVQTVPEGPLRASVQASAAAFRAAPRPFVLEQALDGAYLRTGLQRAECIEAPERGDILRLTALEIDGFNLMLVVRGRHHYHLAAETLSACFVAGGAWDAAAHDALLRTPDLAAAVQAIARHLDVGEDEPLDAPALEALGWNRYLRMANRLFRRSHMQVGAVVGYAAIRRIELANLITLTEGMRLGIEPRRIRQRLIPRVLAEVAHV